jgi:hypothetical protein
MSYRVWLSQEAGNHKQINHVITRTLQEEHMQLYKYVQTVNCRQS